MKTVPVLKVLGIVALVGGGYLLIASLPDIKRYIKMVSM